MDCSVDRPVDQRSNGRAAGRLVAGHVACVVRTVCVAVSPPHASIPTDEWCSGNAVARLSDGRWA